ncbi:MAG: helix-turn-helix domain-containing protein [Sulfuricella sp.]
MAGIQTLAAQLLGINRVSLWRKLKSYRNGRRMVKGW